MKLMPVCRAGAENESERAELLAKDFMCLYRDAQKQTKVAVDYLCRKWFRETDASRIPTYEEWESVTRSVTSSPFDLFGEWRAIRDLLETYETGTTKIHLEERRSRSRAVFAAPTDEIRPRSHDVFVPLVEETRSRSNAVALPPVEDAAKRVSDIRIKAVRDILDLVLAS